jgi:hypothetical protein
MEAAANVTASIQNDRLLVASIAPLLSPGEMGGVSRPDDALLKLVRAVTRRQRGY